MGYSINTKMDLWTGLLWTTNFWIFWIFRFLDFWIFDFLDFFFWTMSYLAPQIPSP